MSIYNIYVTNEPTIVDGKFVEPDGYKKENLKSTGSGANGGAGDKEIFDILYVEGRYVTIYTTENSNNVVSLWEVDVYTAPCDENVVIEVDEKALVGLYDFEGNLVKAVWVENSIEISRSEKIAYVKIFDREALASLKPLKEAEIIEIE